MVDRPKGSTNAERKVIVIHEPLLTTTAHSNVAQLNTGDCFTMKRISKPVKALGLALGLVTIATTAGIAAGNNYKLTGGDNSGAKLECPAGLVRLGHVFDENASVFPGDPSPHIVLATTIPGEGFQVEEVTTGTHTGTHLDAPGHFITGGRTVDQLTAEELVWPAYVIDVRARMAAVADDGFQLSIADIKAYEQQNGKIKKGSMVIIRTGFDQFFRTPAFLDAAPGFAGAAVQWMVDQRKIGGIGSDTFGPDATSDALFSATNTILANGKVAIPGLNNLAALQIKGDIIMAPTVALRAGSGYQTDPLGCLGRDQGGNHDNDD
jgi:kynurenine formamidase